MQKYFLNGDGTYQYHEGRIVNQIFHIKIQVPARFARLRGLLGLKKYHELEIETGNDKSYAGQQLAVHSNSRRLIRSTILFR